MKSSRAFSPFATLFSKVVFRRGVSRRMNMGKGYRFPSNNKYAADDFKNIEAYYQISVDELIIIRIEIKNVAKGEIAHHEQFLHLQQYLQRLSNADVATSISMSERVTLVTRYEHLIVVYIKHN